MLFEYTIRTGNYAAFQVIPVARLKAENAPDALEKYNAADADFKDAFLEDGEVVTIFEDVETFVRYRVSKPIDRDLAHELAQSLTPDEIATEAHTDAIIEALRDRDRDVTGYYPAPLLPERVQPYAAICPQCRGVEIPYNPCGVCGGSGRIDPAGP